MRISDWSSDVCSSDLQAALAEDGVVARVQNAGVSGDTTAAGRQRLTYVLGNAKAKPALVLLGLGGNDMLRGIGPDQTRANLDAMLAELKKRSEEHTSELQSLMRISYAVFCLKKKK